MRKFSNKKIAAVAVGAVVLTGTGVAYAYWTTTGIGSGSAKAAGSGGTLSLAAPTGDNVISGLVPGHTISVPITATNPNTNKTVLSANTLTVSNLDSSNADCDALTARAVATDTDPTSLVTLAPGASGAFGSVQIELPNSADENQDACKNATYTFDVAASYVAPAPAQ